ncbi:MAG: hypothetical protein QOH05_865 [Acetobacteraceae bacterium]|nr:hypothetical protein [Acetobacteraceae bacterium]
MPVGVVAGQVSASAAGRVWRAAVAESVPAPRTAAAAGSPGSGQTVRRESALEALASGASPAPEGTRASEAVGAVRLPAAMAALEAEPPAWVALRGPAASMAWPAGQDLEASDRSCGRSRTASIPWMAAAAVRACLPAEPSGATERRSRHGSAERPGPRAGSATDGGAVAGPKAHPSAATRSAAWRRSYRCLSKNTPCSPNRLAKWEARRHGARRPPSSAASHCSTA